MSRMTAGFNCGLDTGDWCTVIGAIVVITLLASLV
jgi:hypothetical protein